MVKCSMNENRGGEVAEGPVVSGGGRGPSTLSTGQGVAPDGGRTTLGPLAPGQRWSAARRREVVLRLMRGEAAALLSRELGLPDVQARAVAPLGRGGARGGAEGARGGPR